MTLPNHDRSTIADAGSMDSEAMTETADDRGDLDVDHERLAENMVDTDEEGLTADGFDGPNAAGLTGSPVGPPD